jgi:tetratricopeptide (TPR) repeat protein
MRSLPHVLAALLVVLGLGGHAAAQETGHEPPPEAMTLFESAREHYRNGRYPEAIEELERALVLDPAAPTLLFNLGRVYELTGDYDRSIATYERLLALIGPDAEEREQTETTLARLRGARERATPPPTAEEVGTMEEGPTFVRQSGVADDAFWGVLIAGGVVALGAGALGVTAIVLRGRVDNWVLGLDGTLEDRDLTLMTTQGLGIAADVTGGVAVATLAAAVGLYVFRERTYEIWPDGARAFLVPSLGPDGAGLLLGGTL